MKLWLGIPLFAQFALAQTTPTVPCIPPPVRAVPGPAKLSELPAWTSAAVNGDYATGPGYPTAPELAARVDVPEGVFRHC